MKHTPGPWKVYAGRNIDPLESEVLTDEGKNAGAVVICRGAGHNHQANALLISAAPDLLTALDRLLDCPDLTMDCIEQESLDAINQARAAIAKATEE